MSLPDNSIVMRLSRDEAIWLRDLLGARPSGEEVSYGIWARLGTALMEASAGDIHRRRRIEEALALTRETGRPFSVLFSMTDAELDEFAPAISDAMTGRPPMADNSRTPGDVLATTVWNICTEGEEQGWVSGLPPDAKQRLDAAVNVYCDTETTRLALTGEPTCSTCGGSHRVVGMVPGFTGLPNEREVACPDCVGPTGDHCRSCGDPRGCNPDGICPPVDATSGERQPCPTCAGRGWHTADGSDPAACGTCDAGAVWSGNEATP